MFIIYYKNVMEILTAAVLKKKKTFYLLRDKKYTKKCHGFWQEYTDADWLLFLVALQGYQNYEMWESSNCTVWGTHISELINKFQMPFYTVAVRNQSELLFMEIWWHGPI